MTADLNTFLGPALAAFVAVGLWFAWIGTRRRANRKTANRFNQVVSEGRDIPPSLHPIVNPSLCIGSLSCIKACPEGDILGLLDGKAHLVEPTRCIGHGKCELECPVDAISLVFGTREVGQELPDTNERYETSRPGVYVVGELGGMGLIQNALNQGLDCVRQLVKSDPGMAAEPQGAGLECVDVAIVGAGPAGLAAALACVEAGQSYVLLEQGR